MVLTLAWSYFEKEAMGRFVVRGVPRRAWNTNQQDRTVRANNSDQIRARSGLLYVITNQPTNQPVDEE